MKSPSIKAIHDLVKGRRRYHVAGLYRCVPMKCRLENVLSQQPDVFSASANVLTGNLLVIYDERCNPKLILSLLERTVSSLQRAEFNEEQFSDRVSQPGYLPERVENRFSSLLEVRRNARPWHTMGIDEICGIFHTSRTFGLADAQIESNALEHGRNALEEVEGRSGLDIFLEQFNSLPVALLGVAAGLSAMTGGLADAAIVLAVVGLNAVIGYYTESTAEKTIESLKTLIKPTVKVLRGEAAIIEAENVVAGDVLMLCPGTYVAADARIINANRLTLDESILTGESMPVIKTSSKLTDSLLPIGDRTNMIYGGTLVTGGQGLAIVVAVGKNTEMGRIHTLVSNSEPPETPIQKQLTVVGNQLVLISGAVCGLVFIIGFLRGNGIVQMLQIAISLAVAAVPEGLPAVATTTLALGIQKMRRNKVLIRNLDAVCTLGSLQTICFDKTGTVTLNHMTVQSIYSNNRLTRINDNSSSRNRLESLNGDSRILETCSLCNETEITYANGNVLLNGSPTENALIEYALSRNVDVEGLRSRNPQILTLHRSESRQYMATAHNTQDGTVLVCIKGNPVEVLSKCSWMLVDEKLVALDEDHRETIEAQNDTMAGEALRVLGVCYVYQQSVGQVDENNEFIWLGLIGMADPIRPGVKECIKAFHLAGLETVMITGDQGATAYAIGQELGLHNGKPLEMIDSTHLVNTGPELMKALSTNVQVFSRVSPSNKLQVVQALQSNGKIVAMTGDGINDGPALKAADVGIAMGASGTDVAREVADVVLEDDDLQTLIIAVRDGRTIYRNIRKTLHYLLATNFTEIEVMFATGALGLGYPLNSMQLLWINLVSDIFPGLALALEEPEPDIMMEKPRDPEEPIVRSQDFMNIAKESGVMSLSCLMAYFFGISRYGISPAASSIAFHSLTASQIVHAYNCRSEAGGSRDSQPNRNDYLDAAVSVSLVLQLMLQFVPGLRSIMGLTPLTLTDLLIAAGSSAASYFVCSSMNTNDKEMLNEQGIHTHIRIGDGRTSRQTV